MKALRSTKVKIFLTVLLVYLFYIAPDYATSTTNRYIYLTKSIVDDRRFDIDKYRDRTRDIAGHNGHCYIGAAPGLGLMAVPIYIVLKPVLKAMPEAVYRDLELNFLILFFSVFLSILPGALIALFLYNLLEKFDLRTKERMLIVFASSFGTILFYYSAKFVAHVLSTFMLFSAFYIAFKFKNAQPKKILFFLAGICLGIAVLSDYLLFIGSALLAGYFISDFRKDRIPHYIFLILGASLMAALHFFYHYSCFGSPFALATARSPMIGPIPFSLPQPKIVYELSFGTYRGAFLYMPILLISVYGVVVFFRKPEKKYLAEMIFILLYSVLTFLAVSIFCSKTWPLGGDFGPRYLIPLVPFLMIPIAFAYKRLKYKMIFWIATLSVFINWCGIQYGDSDNVSTNIGLFVFRGLNSNLAEWMYKLTNIYVRKLNVITHFSPLIPFIGLLAVIYIIWKKEIDRLAQVYFCKEP